MKEQNKKGKNCRNEFFGWDIADYLRVFGLVLNTNRNESRTPQSSLKGDD